MDIFQAISEGLHDEDLQQIINAAKARQKAIPLKPGDKVVVLDCSPKYMEGIKGEVLHKTSKKNHGDAVYLVRPLPEEVWKLTGTKMTYWSGGEVRVKDINMPRGTLAKIVED